MTATTATVLPGRQVRWTRLGAGMGYTNTEAQRAAIRAALDRMDWVDPDQLCDVLDAAPIRYYVGGLFYGRPWALAAAAVSPFGDQQRLVGLRSVSGERYLLLDLGYEAIDLLHDTPTTQAVGRS
jgi:hypothetical protein